MRGIAGILNFDSRATAPLGLHRIIAAMKVGHFDRSAEKVTGSARFAHLQRDQTPEDRFERQPIVGAGGNFLLVTDAVLENRAELAADFGWSAAETAARPDSAFVVGAYEKWGEGCPNRLEGKWAFSVWNARERRLFAAVDHFSFRPLYYARFGSTFAFASTLRGLLSLPEVDREIDDDVLGGFLLFTRSEPTRTLYRGIQALPAAHFLSANAFGTAVSRYWRADPSKTLKLKSDADYAAAFNVELERAVVGGLRTSGAVGVMVSGGLDSASVTAVAGEVLAARGLRLRAFHRMAPKGDPRSAFLREHDESSYVRRMQASMPHIDFHFLPASVEPPAISLDRWDEMFDQHCGPFRGAAFERPPIGTTESSLAVDTMLFGLGGNYAVSLETYPSDYFAQLFVQLQWRHLWSELKGHRAFYGRSITHLIKQRILYPVLGRRNPSNDGRFALLDLLNPEFVRRASLRDRVTPKARWEAADFSVKSRTAWIVNELMPQNRGVAKSVLGPDYNCAAHLPLMSHRLNEFCLSLPVEQQISNGADRLLLRKSMRGRLPDEVIWRKTRGFATPRSWQHARALLSVLPTALAQLERSPTVGAYINVGELRRKFTGVPESELRRLSASRFLDLIGVAWFLRWIDERAT